MSTLTRHAEAFRGPGRLGRLLLRFIAWAFGVEFQCLGAGRESDEPHIVSVVSTSGGIVNVIGPAGASERPSARGMGLQSQQGIDWSAHGGGKGTVKHGR